MSVQRWGCRPVQAHYPTDEGRFVLYADHVAALLTQDQQHGEQSHAHYMDGYAAALDAARDAVAALLGKTVPPSDGVTEALAAIDALVAGQAPAAPGEARCEQTAVVNGVTVRCTVVGPHEAGEGWHYFPYPEGEVTP